MASNIKEEPVEDIEDSTIKTKRLPELRAVNSIDCIYWRKVESELKLAGKSFATGQFTEAENNQLRKNWARLTRNCPFKEPEIILRRRLCPELGPSVREFIQENSFYKRLGHKINRTQYIVYTRARKMFHPASKSGKYSDDEVKNLKCLELTHGNKWEEIGRAMGRTGHSALKKSHALKKDVIKGRWNPDEDKQLVEAVEKVIKEREEEREKQIEKGEKMEDESDGKSKNFFNLPWVEIAGNVPTRNAKQCRERWIKYSNSDSADEGRRKNMFPREEQLKLVKELIASGTKEESKVDWMTIYKKFTELTSPQCLREKWYRMKLKIENYRSKEFEEILKIIAKKLSRPRYHSDSSDDEPNTEKVQDSEPDEDNNVQNKSIEPVTASPLKKKRKRTSNESPLSQTQNLSNSETGNESLRKSKRRKTSD